MNSKKGAWRAGVKIQDPYETLKKKQSFQTRQVFGGLSTFTSLYSELQNDRVRPTKNL